MLCTLIKGCHTLFSVTQVEAQYLDNPYHNSQHAAEVLHATNYMLRHSKLVPVLTLEDRFAILLATIVHDMGHPGRNNAFQINTQSSFAVQYNDMHVLEMHHAAQAFQIAQQRPDCNIFKHLSPKSFKQVRSFMIELVLATDMAKHFELVGVKCILQRYQKK